MPLETLPRLFVKEKEAIPSAPLFLAFREKGITAVLEGLGRKQSSYASSGASRKGGVILGGRTT